MKSKRSTAIKDEFINYIEKITWLLTEEIKVHESSQEESRCLVKTHSAKNKIREFNKNN